MSFSIVFDDYWEALTLKHTNCKWGATYVVYYEGIFICNRCKASPTNEDMILFSFANPLVRDLTDLPFKFVKVMDLLRE